ncbi:MAG: biotin--[acetyl-CoA-carboxylase] ligase [Nitrososphaerales archaeon]
MNLSFLYFNEVDSTQDLAIELYKEGHREGTVIIAKKQRKGRGRYGKVWYSPEGGLYLSLILEPKNKENLPLIALIACKAVKKALEYRFRLKLRIKFPNDLLYKDKKLAGFLLESSFKGEELEYCILGIGLNVNNSIPQEIEKEAISLKQILKKESNIKELTNLIIKEFFELYKKGFEGLIGTELWYGGKAYLLNSLKASEVELVSKEGRIILSY